MLFINLLNEKERWIKFQIINIIFSYIIHERILKISNELNENL